jgi:membrane carboxypeptidase/penicillin-binding protein
MGRNMTGGGMAAPLWAEFMLNAFGASNQEFQVPDNIVFKKICTKSGKLATQHCPTVVDAPFVEGTEVTQECTIHGGVNTNFLSEDMQSFDEWDDESAASGEEGATAVPKKPKSKPAPKPGSESDDDIGGEAPAAGSGDTLNF